MSTPPHQPTYGVNLTEEAIRTIIEQCLPGNVGKVNIRRLHHDKSWNNRIYFVECSSLERYVLKLGGRPFLAAKIENEVICLSLLEKYCPDIPTPRLIAWSLDGEHVQLAKSHSGTTQNRLHSIDSACPAGWILMTQLEGESFDPATAGSEDRARITTQLARAVSNWRRNLPKSPCCGNVHARESLGYETVKSDLRPASNSANFDFDVNGVFEVGLHHSGPMKSLYEFWKTRLSWAVNTLATKREYEAIRADGRQEKLENFIKHVLLKVLRVDAREVEIDKAEQFVFSHTDLSPRNVLVCGSPLKISGIVDFEYAGFFPILQDFMGKSIVSIDEDPEGWPLDMHTDIIKEYERLSREDKNLLLPSASSREWNVTYTLLRLETYIAPWCLSADMVSPETKNLELQLQEAGEIVDQCILTLERSASRINDT